MTHIHHHPAPPLTVRPTARTRRSAFVIALLPLAALRGRCAAPTDVASASGADVAAAAPATAAHDHGNDTR